MESSFWRDYAALAEDPIAKERERLARERFIDGLFRPFHDHDELEELAWLVEGLLPVGYLVLLAGNPKSGKTSFATALALAVAHGVPFAGRPTQQTSVLWISAEESATERRQLVKESPLYQTDAPFWTCYEKLFIDDPANLELLDEWVGRTHAQLLVVDPLMGAMGGRSLRDGYNARRTLQPLKDWCASRRVTAIVLHHQKRDWYRMRPSVADSSQLAAVSSMSIVLSSFQSAIPPLPIHRERGPGGEGSKRKKGRKTTPPRGEGTCKQSEQRGGVTSSTRPEQARIVRLACEGRGAWANRTQLFASTGPLDYAAIDAEPAHVQPERPMSFAEKQVFDQLSDPDGTTVAQIAERIKTSVEKVRNYLANLRRKGLVSVAPGSNWPKKYVPRTQLEGA